MAIFVEHYRQPISELSTLAFYEGLKDLSPREMEAACQEALRTSEFMPVVATIRQSLERVRASRADREEYAGVPLLTYPEVSQEERERALAETEETKRKIMSIVRDHAKKIRFPLTSPASARTLAEQKEILRKKGFLK